MKVLPRIAPISAPAGTPGVAATAAKHWAAAIELDFEHRRDRTALVRSSHVGPLRVQRPFYPEGGCCHLYLLHPPGGMVPGDELSVALSLASGSHLLMTTPSAGKVYRSDAHATRQRQGVMAKVAAGAMLEWLPQETIVFEGAQGILHNRFELSGDASLCAWDIVVLGRRASGEAFRHGRCEQLIEVYREGRPLLHERTNYIGGSAMLTAPWGMASASVSGSMVVTLSTNRDQLDSLRESLAALALAGEWGLSQKGELLLVRYLGDSAEKARWGFEHIWARVRPMMGQAVVSRPRIWNT
ncbi:MAG: urease accessory protein UreD [Spongiibacter sp.]|nr:urease accessory protein UreD [Spongiibacter sp.]